jgi:hypothetical protein
LKKLKFKFYDVECTTFKKIFLHLLSNLVPLGHLVALAKSLYELGPRGSPGQRKPQDLRVLTKGIYILPTNEVLTLAVESEQRSLWDLN